MKKRLVAMLIAAMIPMALSAAEEAASINDHQ